MTRVVKRLIWFMSKSDRSIPMDERAASRMSLASCASPVIFSSSGRCSSLSAPLCWMACASLANLMLSGTIFTSSGKCHEYHSLARMANVFRSLSIWSSRQMDWMIMLSTRFTLNLTLAREYACPSASCALSRSTSFNWSMYLCRLARTPRSSSTITVLLDAGSPAVSWMTLASLSSPTPSRSFFFFLSDFICGMFISRKLRRRSGRAPSLTLLISSRACSPDVKGWKATCFTSLLNLEKSAALSATASTVISSTPSA
mmetsp:Transcript_7884/g.19872  ORF Transcript_7884/g.19872 Transcript_7884/m.19872 type:complete len:258 (+) Transcript_7884:755-1528(+)